MQDFFYEGDDTRRTEAEVKALTVAITPIEHLIAELTAGHNTLVAHVVALTARQPSPIAEAQAISTSTDDTGTTYEQGTCGIGTGDLQLDNTSVTSGQNVTITTWTRTQGGA